MKSQRIFNSITLYCSNCEVPLKRVLYHSYGKIKRQIICECHGQFLETNDESFAQLTERVLRSFGTYLPPYDGDLSIYGFYSAWFFPLEVPFDRPFVNVRLHDFD